MSKRRCRECNAILYKTKLSRNINILSIQIFAIIGLLFVSLSLLMYVLNVQNLPLMFLNKGVSKSITDFADSNNEEVRAIALNLTGECNTADSYCHAKQLYYNLRDIRYVPSEPGVTLYPPLYVYKNGGDCRNTASMFVAMMRSLGFKAHVDCDITENHCISVVPRMKNYDSDYMQNIVVDLAGDYFVILNKSIDIWSYDD